ncbi:MAG: hypothetical protein PHV05_11315 [Candidatus Riflebacteria bacterium]|nr:hypothetical protein [Candidatus Riflebacteria bacterium]
MTAFLSIAWALTELLLIISVATALILLIIAILHPLCLDLHLRGSRIGQKAELWFSYLFGIFKIGLVATPHRQNVVIKILFWKKLLKTNGRKKVFKPQPASDRPPTEPPSPPAMTPVEILPAKETTEDIQSQPDTATITKTTETLDKPPAQTSQPAETIVDTNDAQTKKSTAATEKAATDLPDATEISATEPEQTTSAPPSATNIDTEPLKPLKQVEEEQVSQTAAARQAPETSSAKHSTRPTPEESFRQKLRRGKRNFSDHYRQGKKYVKISIDKWNKISPALKRFWGRSRKGFSLINPELMVRYALHEPYLTGMFHGTMSIFSGLAHRFGVVFTPIPVFTGPTIYAKASARAVIRPWCFTLAFVGILFEKQLYKELWFAFKWYKNNRASK